MLFLRKPQNLNKTIGDKKKKKKLISKNRH